jgi:hypothetical protein
MLLTTNRGDGSGCAYHRDQGQVAQSGSDLAMERGVADDVMVEK